MQTFFPEKSTRILASSPYPPNTYYIVSIGYEMWDNTPTKVIKVQMELNGKLSGKRSPSYPVDTDDVVKVKEAILELHKLE